MEYQPHLTLRSPTDTPGSSTFIADLGYPSLPLDLICGLVSSAKCMTTGFSRDPLLTLRHRITMWHFKRTIKARQRCRQRRLRAALRALLQFLQLRQPHHQVLTQMNPKRYVPTLSVSLDANVYRDRPGAAPKTETPSVDSASAKSTKRRS
jgi:hypothetical protein